VYEVLFAQDLKKLNVGGRVLLAECMCVCVGGGVRGGENSCEVSVR
jgi:hypothetical protein